MTARLEGESELSTDQGTEQSPNLYLYTGADNILLLYTMLDSGNENILDNWPNKKYSECNTNRDIPVKIPCF